MSIKTISLPASKSIANRLLILDQLLENRLQITNLSDADDTKLLQQALNEIKEGKEEIYVGNAGTAFRFLTAYLAIQNKRIALFGNEDMENRPIKPLVDALTHIGSSITYLKKIGYPPLLFSPLTQSVKDELTIKGDMSSQFISALTMIGAFLPDGLLINIEGELKSASYFKMTVDLMLKLGFKVAFNRSQIRIDSNFKLNETKVEVEADWSSASYWYSYLALGEIGEKYLLKRLTLESLQGDSVIAELFTSLGIKSSQAKEGVLIEKVSNPSIDVLTYNFSSVPDIVQTLAVTCLGLGIDGRFEGVSHLKYKETNRLQALKSEIEKLGGKVELGDDLLLLSSPEKLKKEVFIKSYQDHRMVMSFAVLSRLGIEITFDDKSPVSKSYPQFWKVFEDLHT